MTGSPTQAAGPTRVVKRHPIRGFLGGIPLGLGALVVLVLTGQAAFTSWVPYVLIVAGSVVFGVLVGTVPPPMRSRRQPPV